MPAHMGKMLSYVPPGGVSSVATSVMAQHEYAPGSDGSPRQSTSKMSERRQSEMRSITDFSRKPTMPTDRPMRPMASQRMYWPGRSCAGSERYSL